MSSETIAQIEKAGGYARVFPEHKYGIVRALQSEGHIVGMTGDGVNDSPAIKQANVGIAVSGATDAARAAAALVLTAPGLSVIVRAVEEARRIFERMNSYAIYRIVETIRIMFFVVLAIICFNFYPITAIMIILLAFFNNVPIMAIAFDNTRLDPKPVRWNMRHVLTLSTVLGLTGVAGSFLMLIVAMMWLKLDMREIQTFVFLKMAVAGHLTLFVTRTADAFWKKPHPAPILLWSAIVTKILATLFVVYPCGLISPIHWRAVGVIWAYCIAWLFMGDYAKLLVLRHIEMSGRHHVRFLELLKKGAQSPVAANRRKRRSAVVYVRAPSRTVAGEVAFRAAGGEVPGRRGADRPGGGGPGGRRLPQPGRRLLARCRGGCGDGDDGQRPDQPPAHRRRQTVRGLRRPGRPGRLRARHRHVPRSRRTPLAALLSPESTEARHRLTQTVVIRDP